MFTILVILNMACLIATLYTMRTEFLFISGVLVVIQSLIAEKEYRDLKKANKPKHKPPSKSITNGKSKKKKSS